MPEATSQRGVTGFYNLENLTADGVKALSELYERNRDEQGQPYIDEQLREMWLTYRMTLEKMGNSWGQDPAPYIKRLDQAIDLDDDSL